MLTPFHELSQRQLDQVVEIYEEALAARWEWTEDEVRELAATPDGPISALAALEAEDVGGEHPVAGGDVAGGDVAGFIICQYLPEGRLWYIHYFAVRDDLRGKGWGGRILTAALPLGELAAASQGHAGSLGTVLEVEAVGGAQSDVEREHRVRRVRFYQRHGALMAGVKYPRPPWSPPEMPDFDLLFIPGKAWDGRVDCDFRRSLVWSLMVEGYEVDPAEPWLQAYLAEQP